MGEGIVDMCRARTAPCEKKEEVLEFSSDDRGHQYKMRVPRCGGSIYSWQIKAAITFSGL